MTDKEVVRELRRAKAALSALSRLPDERPATEHADAITAWLLRLSVRLDNERL